MKNILIVDDDVDTSLRYKKWLEDEGFILTLINDPYIIEQNFKPEDYDLVLIGFRTSVMDGFELYQKLYEMSKKVQQDTSSSTIKIFFIKYYIIYVKVTKKQFPINEN